jgi:hypothetical protein
MTGQLGEDGTWHGFMRPAKTASGAERSGETPRALAC